MATISTTGVIVGAGSAAALTQSIVSGGCTPELNYWTFAKAIAIGGLIIVGGPTIMLSGAAAFDISQDSLIIGDSIQIDTDYNYL